MDKLKVMVVTTHPIQYLAPLYRFMAEAYPCIDLVVVFLTDGGTQAHFETGFGRAIKWDIDLLSGYRHVFLEPGLQIEPLSFSKRYSRRLFRTLRAERPDWIWLYGYSSLMNWVAMGYAVFSGTRVIYFSDSNAKLDGRETRGAFSKFRRLAKFMIVGLFFRGVSTFLSPSQANQAYLERYGVASNKIVRSPFAIDVNRFRKAVCPTASRPYNFVWVGKLIPLKRCQDYLEALVRLRGLGLKFRAGLVGSGPQAGKLQAMIDNLECSGHLIHHGFVNQDDMPSVLAKADTLIFTSAGESFGLVATEAAACGCALVLADEIGCIGEWGPARPGQNCYIYETRNVEDLVGRMTTLIREPRLLQQLKEQSDLIAPSQDVNVAGSIIRDALLCPGIESV